MNSLQNLLPTAFRVLYFHFHLTVFIKHLPYHPIFFKSHTYVNGYAHHTNCTIIYPTFSMLLEVFGILQNAMMKKLVNKYLSTSLIIFEAKFSEMKILCRQYEM